MRAYRKGGRVAVILRLTLPIAEREGDAERALSKFYSALAEAYFKGAERLSRAHKDSDATPTVLTVDYELVDSQHFDSVIKVKRFLRVNAGSVSQKYEIFDVFDAASGLLLKRARKAKSKKVKKKAPNR